MSSQEKIAEMEKGCGEVFTHYIYGEHKCGNFEDLKHSDHIIYCISCQAKLEAYKQGLAGKEKEVLEKIDFLKTYPIWCNIIDKETNEKKEIPEELYPILDNFLEMIIKTLKQQLGDKK